MINEKIIINHISKFNLNLKTRENNPRFFDQKVQPDIVEVISNCILNFTKKKYFFTVRDIWDNKYSGDLVYEILRKPKVSDPKAENEYDKFFSQPICFLTFFGTLHRERKSGKFYYTVLNKKILEFISLNQNNSLKFINICLQQFLLKNKLNLPFQNFFKLQNRGSYLDLREAFYNFIYNNTNIKKSNIHEPGRIFTPIINVLAFNRQKKGSIKGNISSHPIYRDDLNYGRPNWKDILTKKPRGLTREVWEQKSLDLIDEQQALNSAERSSKKAVINRHNSISEHSGKSGATHTHHIFPRSFFYKLCSYRENLIRITPNEHLGMAHPNSNTQKVDKKFQIELLFFKLKSIEISLKKKDGFYNLHLFVELINEGYNIKLPTDLSISDTKKVLKSRIN